MTGQEMWTKSFERPSNYFYLSAQERWDIDVKLGLIEDFDYVVSSEDKTRFNEYFLPNLVM